MCGAAVHEYSLWKRMIGHYRFALSVLITHIVLYHLAGHVDRQLETHRLCASHWFCAAPVSRFYLQLFSLFCVPRKSLCIVQVAQPSFHHTVSDNSSSSIPFISILLPFLTLVVCCYVGFCFSFGIWIRNWLTIHRHMPLKLMVMVWRI